MARGSRATRSSFPSATPPPTTASWSRCSPPAWPTAASICSVGRWRGCCASWGPRRRAFVRRLRRPSATAALRAPSSTASIGPATSSRSAWPRATSSPATARWKACFLAGRSRAPRSDRARARGVRAGLSRGRPAATCSRAAGSPAATVTSFRCPSAGGPCKRLHLFLRWMVRREPPDFGLWTSRVAGAPAHARRHPRGEHEPGASASRAGARAPGRWPRRSPRTWPPSIPPTPSSSTSPSATSACRATASTAASPSCVPPCGLREVCRHWRGVTRRRTNA